MKQVIISAEVYEADLERLRRLEKLCRQAADALEDNMNVNLDRELIAELRKAAE